MIYRPERMLSRRWCLASWLEEANLTRIRFRKVPCHIRPRVASHYITSQLCVVRNQHLLYSTNLENTSMYARICEYSFERVGEKVHQS